MHLFGSTGNSPARNHVLHSQQQGEEMQPDYAHYADELGLELVDPETFTLKREPYQNKFRYIRTNGRPVSRKHIERMIALVIPPAWTEVFCCDSDRGHIQAVGKDDLGRRQYIYHPKWEAVRNNVKTHRLLAFVRVMRNMPRMAAAASHC